MSKINKQVVLDYAHPTIKRNWGAYLTWLPGCTWAVTNVGIILGQRLVPAVSSTVVYALIFTGIAIGLSIFPIIVFRRKKDDLERFAAICFALSLIAFSLITPIFFYRDD